MAARRREDDHPMIHPKNRWEYKDENNSDVLGSGPSQETLGHDHVRNGEVNNSGERSAEKVEKSSPGGADEKGAEGEEQRPIGFFHPKLNKIRLEVILAWAKTTLILMTFILAVMSIYWGVLSHVERNVSSLVVYVVDFDGQLAPYNTGEKPLIGPQIVQMTEQMAASPMQHLGYVILPPSSFNNDPMQVREAVYQQQAWAAIVINANATALLRAAVAQGNASYDPLGACQLIYVEARDQTTYSEYITPELNKLQTEATSKFGEMWTAIVMKNTTIPRENLQSAPQALSPAIGFSTFNLRPFKPAVMIPTVNIGLIYLIIVSFFSVPFFMPVHMKFTTAQGHPPLRFWQLILWRWLSTITAYFLMSLAYSLVSLAFQIPFTNPTATHTEVAQNPNSYGRGTFVVYWMINFVGMASLGLICENVAMLIGQPWMALWLIFWVITNVST
ncbi:MAG: hypothetical protein M1830_003191, partial [Pleopsidium flavum]